MFAEQSDSLEKKPSLKEETTKALIEKKSTFISVSYGLSNYLGDLGGNKGIGKKFIYDNNLKKRTSFVGFSFSHIRKEALGLRLSYTNGEIAGSDQDASFKDQSDDAYTRYKRNLDFKTKISEWSLLFEVYPLKFLHQTKKIFHWNVQPYFLYGFGRFKFNPQGSYFDEIAADYIWVDLHPLRTEGQGMKEYPDRKPYKLTQLNMPYGLGVQYKVGQKTSVGFEFIGRKLFTDYLDDVSTTFIDPRAFENYLSQDDYETAKAVNNKSNLIDPNNPYKAGEQRGNPKYNDFYYSFNIKLSVQINKKRKKVSTQPQPKMNPAKWKHYKYDSTEICE